jgi:hypothetical protein
VKLVVSTSAGSDSVNVPSMIIFGSGAAAPMLTRSNDTIYCSNAAAYQWYFNGSPVPGAVDSFYVITGDGNYAVMITDDLGCSRLSNGVVITALQYLDGGAIRIYPNPVGDQFTVYGLRFTESATIDIYNIIGEKVYSDLLNSKQETVKCKVFSPGIYFIEVSSGQRVYRAKFVKE